MTDNLDIYLGNEGNEGYEDVWKLFAVWDPGAVVLIEMFSI